jgi:hypothetical protein
MMPPKPSLCMKLAAKITRIGATKNGNSTSISGDM